MDTIEGCLSIASRGQLYGEEYLYYKDGISRMRNHILGGKFNGEIAGAYASRVLYLAASILVGTNSVMKITSADEYAEQRIGLLKPKSFSYLRIVDPIAYGYIIEAEKFLQEIF